MACRFYLIIGRTVVLAVLCSVATANSAQEERLYTTAEHATVLSDSPIDVEPQVLAWSLPTVDHLSSRHEGMDIEDPGKQQLQEDSTRVFPKTYGVGPLGAVDDGEIENADEPGGTVGLNIDPSESCPGFFILRVDDRPSSAFDPGSYGAEVVLEGTGVRLLQGGLNFGAAGNQVAPAFAAFSIANVNNENQTLDVEVAVEDSLGSGATVDIELVNRTGGANETLISRRRFVSLDQPDKFSTEVPPGFYVIRVTPPAGTPVFASVSALTGYPDRAGGGFQGGAVFGGWHDTHMFPISGFAGFCVSEPYTANIRTEARPTRGPGGARGLRITLRDRNGLVLFREPEDVVGGDDHGDSCSTASRFGDISSSTSNFSWPGEIESEEDIDFFEFELSANSNLTVETIGSLDTVGRIYNSSCDPIAENDDSGDGLNFKIDRQLSSGKYYASVRAYSASATGQYEINLSALPTSSDVGDVTSTFLFENQLLFPVNLEVNGEVIGSAPSQTTSRFTYSGPSSVEITAELIRPTNPSGTAIGDRMNMRFDQIDVEDNSTVTFRINWQIGSSYFFAPVITNREGFGVEPTVNKDLQSQNRCPCAIGAGSTNVRIGYYRLFSNSNIWFRSEDNRQWSVRNFADSVTSGSGRFDFTFDL